MAGEKQAEDASGLRELGAMSLDEVAGPAAANPESIIAQVATIEIQRRVAEAQLKAAEAQTSAAKAHKITAWATLALISAALIFAIGLVTYLEIRSGD